MELKECNLREVPKGGFVCDRCGKPLDQKLRRRCRLAGEEGPTIETSDPGVVRQVWNYSAAVTRWITAGSPTRSPDEISRIFSICEACPHFANDNRPHCKLCGCSLSKAPDGLRNKIRFSTESCPDDPPQWS